MRTKSLLLAGTLLLAACTRGEFSGDILGGVWCQAIDTPCHQRRDAYLASLGAKTYDTYPGPAQPRYYVTQRGGVRFPDKSLDRMVNFQGPMYVTRPVY